MTKDQFFVSTDGTRMRFPWDITRYEFLTDSAGAGKWRGAPGIIWEGVNESGDCIAPSMGSDGWYTQAQGQQGGQPTPLNKLHIMRGSDRIDVLQPHVAQNIKDGDIIVSETGGGAGVGSPEERDPKAVQMDVQNELVSLKAARDVYKVVLDPDTLKIDYTETKKLRGNKN